jgi:hypothetical protein
VKEKKGEKQNILERGYRVKEEINPRNFGGSRLSRIIRRESVRNSASSIVRINWC